MKRKKIKSSWTEYFNFSARERRGAFFLACILAMQVIVLIYLRNYQKPFPKPDAKIISMLIDASKKENADTVEKKTFTAPEVNNKIILTEFDPNQPDEQEWLNLGISRKQTNVVKNYLSHGGKFRVKKDFKKMYCIPAVQYSMLEPYILLPDTIIHEALAQKKIFKKVEPVDIQTADSSALLALKGIGPVFALRIVKYREKLGGFYSKEQLKEVWGFTDSLYESLLPCIVLNDTVPFRFIHLNTDTFSVLAAHPYIRSKIAGLICSYRKQHKIFSSASDLNHLPLITDEIFRKLAHYVRLD